LVFYKLNSAIERGTKPDALGWRSCWIPGSYAPALSEKRNSFFRLLKNQGFKEERMTKVELYAIGSSTPLESNKSLGGSCWWRTGINANRSRSRWHCT
jgi:hypothetical protein